MPPTLNCSPTSLITRCASVTSLVEARQLHGHIITTITTTTTTTTTIPPNPTYLNNNLLSMYVRCRATEDAIQVFDGMPQRNTVTYNALISAYSKTHESGIMAVGLFAEMGAQALRPTGLTFTSLLQAASVLKDRVVGSSLHGQVILYGFERNTRVLTSVVGMYGNCGDVESARRAFGCQVEKDVVAWNAMIFGCLKNEKLREGMGTFSKMMIGDVQPNEFTYSMILNACGRLDWYDCGRVMHSKIIVSNVIADLPLMNALLDMYASCRDIEAMTGLFRLIDARDIVSWNSVILGYAESGHGEKAIQHFIRLHESSTPKLDEYTLAAAISACVLFLNHDFGQSLHGLVIKLGLESSSYIGSVLLSMYFDNGANDSARSIFHSLWEKDIVVWTEMITAHSRMGDSESALSYFAGMFKDGHKIDSFSLSGALSACADLATPRQGETIHSLSVKAGLGVDMAVCGSLVNMYAKNGNLQSAESIFREVSVPDLMCWNSMLGGYGDHGLAQMALKVFEQILLRGLIPDQVTFLSALSACSHGFLVDKGKFLWNCMEDFGIRPGPKHYSCIIDLLSRDGLLNEAEEIIRKSPFYSSHLELWKTLLGACVNHRNLVIGVQAAKQVLSLNPLDSATHILLSNLYAAVGKWEDAAQVRSIRGMKMDKAPGLSWTDAPNNCTYFSSGNILQLKIDETQRERNRLKANLVVKEADSLYP